MRESSERRSESPVAKKARARKILSALERAYPDAKIALDFTTPLELLVATILSAQCTDERVNLVTPALFRAHRSAADYARLEPETLEKAIHSTGFFQAHGRRTCTARKPACPVCPVRALCPWPDKTRP